jgi:hypothetical protein
VADQWQLEKLALVGLKHPISFYTPGVSRSDLGALGSEYFANVEDALNDLVSGLPDHASVAVVPDGPYAYARVGSPK